MMQLSTQTSSSLDRELAEVKDLALSLVERTGPIVAGYFQGKLKVDLKSDGSPVTVADRECEKVMREMISARFPAHGIIGEEFGTSKQESEYVWVLDPIDGTKSFISGGFDFGTLIGVLRNGEPILGIISQPVLNQVTVGDNISCLFNGEQVWLREDRKLSEALCLITDITLPARFQNSEGFQALTDRVGAVRTWGNCFGYSLLVRGLADVMIDPIMSPWDLLPLIPVVRGAGGVISDYQGTDPVGASSIIAASRSVHDEVVMILNGRAR